MSLAGPAPTARQVRSVVVQIDSLPGHALKVSLPRLGEWMRVVWSPEQLARAVAEAFREAQCAAYADFRGEVYDQDAPERGRTGRAERRRLGGFRTDTYDPRAWARYEDGTWRSPAGLRYRRESQVVARVIQRRIALGLPPEPSALPVSKGDD
jgi:hypothetical protein